MNARGWEREPDKEKYIRPAKMEKKKKKKKEKEREGSLNANADRPGSHTSRDRGPRETGGGRQWPAAKERRRRNERTNAGAIQPSAFSSLIPRPLPSLPRGQPLTSTLATADNQTPGKITVDFQCHSVYITFPDNTPALHIYCTINNATEAIGATTASAASSSSNTMDHLMTMPNYSYIFKFEDEFEHTDAKIWFNRYWTGCFYYVGIYMLVIFTGQQLMANRPRYELRGPLICWNILLATFSIIGACRTIPELVYVTRHFGLYHSICVPSYIEDDKVSGFWATMFVLSKVPELGDTMFIVLRKQPLIFLHWYHHATVLVYCWYAFKEYTAPARWFIVMNFTVHAFMYSYYALKAMNYRVPRFVSMAITVAQLSQMVGGCAVNLWAYQLKQNGEACNVSEHNIKMSLLMYFSYFVLFARFFYKAYVDRRAPRKGLVDTRGSSGTASIAHSSANSSNGTAKKVQ